MQVKLIVAILTNNEDVRQQAIKKLEAIYGPADFKGENHPFTHSKYYNEEMGENLSRNLVSFEKLIQPTTLPEIKVQANKLEQELGQNGKRQVNIDPGYLDHNKVVLASTKEGGHRLLAAEKIYLDFTLYYNKGWQPLPWTYPDFKDKPFSQELEQIRKIFTIQLKQNSQ
ncbi:MAG: DUF4416 family protein [Pseudomonadota bacterium]